MAPCTENKIYFLLLLLYVWNIFSLVSCFKSLFLQGLNRVYFLLSQTPAAMFSSFLVHFLLSGITFSSFFCSVLPNPIFRIIIYLFSNSCRIYHLICAGNFITLLSYVWYLSRYICIPFDLQVDAVVSVKSEEEPFCFIFTPCKNCHHTAFMKWNYLYLPFYSFRWKRFFFFCTKPKNRYVWKWSQ